MTSGNPRGSWKAVTAVGFGIFSDSFLYGLVVPLLPVSPTPIDAGQVGLLYSMYAIGLLVLTPVCAFLADRYGRRKTLLAGVAAQCVVTALFAWAPSFWILGIARVLQGGAAAATWTAGLAVVADTYREDRVQKLGLAMAGMTIGSLLGPLAGGFLYDVWGYGIPFAVAGGLVMLDGLFRLTLLPNDPGQPAFSNPLPTLLRDRTVLSSALVIALIAGSWAVVDPYLPAHLTTTFGVSPTFVGVLFTVAGVAYALVTNPVQRMSETRGIRNTILFGMVLMAVSLPLLVSVPSLPFAVVLLCLVSVAFAFAMNPTLAGLADVADRRAPGAYASAYAVFNLAYAVGMIGADLLTGPLVRNFSLAVGFLGMSLVLLASLPVLWWTEKIPSTKETGTS